MKSLTLVTKWE